MNYALVIDIGEPVQSNRDINQHKTTNAKHVEKQLKDAGYSSVVTMEHTNVIKRGSTLSISSIPTKDNILREVADTFAKCKEGDTLIVHISNNKNDQDKSSRTRAAKRTHKDEMINFITTNQIHDTLLKSRPTGVRLRLLCDETVIIDII